MPKQSQMSQIIHAAFPDLSEKEIPAVSEDSTLCAQAIELALKNAWTHKIILGMNGFGFQDMLFAFEENDQDFCSKLNPFYKTALPKGDSSARITYGDVCLQAHDYQIFVTALKPYENCILPFKTDTLFHMNAWAPVIRKDIFAVPKKTSEKKEFLKQKEGLDVFLSEMGKIFGTQNFWQELFSDRIEQIDSLEGEYAFHKNSENKQTIMDVCLENNLPNTAIQMIDEVYGKNKDYNAVVRLLKGAVTFNLFKENKRLDFTKQPKNGVTKVMDHLRDILPVHLYHSQVEGRRMWNDTGYQRGELQLE